MQLNFGRLRATPGTGLRAARISRRYRAALLVATSCFTTLAFYLASPPGAAEGAEFEAAQRVTLFREVSSARTGICAERGSCDLNVVHPQTDVSAKFAPGIGVALGYAVDIVSGATPRTFTVDTVSTATKFADTRHQLHGAISYARPIASTTIGVSTGWESDYRSTALTVSTRSDLVDRQLTLGISYTHNFDDVCDQDNRGAAGRPLDRLALVSSQNCFRAAAAGAAAAEQTATRRLNIDSMEPSLTWAVTPQLLLQGGTTIQILDGFQSNPYRRVEMGSAGRSPQESLPTLRQRFALFGRAAYIFPRTRTSLQAMGRLYRDTWSVDAVTGEVVVNQYLARFLLFAVRGRLHAQRGAIFYRDAQGYRVLGPNSQFWTGDRELSPLRSLLVGGKFSYIRVPETANRGFFSELEAAVKWEGLFYQLDSPSAPNADRKLAMVAQLALSLRF